VILYPFIRAGMEGTGVPIRLDIWEFFARKAHQVLFQRRFSGKESGI